MEAGTELKPATKVSPRPAAGRERALGLAGRANLPLIAIVLGGFALTAWFTVKVNGWALMTDELQHVKLAQSIADTLNPLPRIRGEHIGAYGQLYPLLTAPAYGLFSMPVAFKVVHVLNALIMASTAIPAYLLTRSVTGSRPLAWVVAALAVAIPWMGMANLMMTEVAAYPAFVWAVFAIYNAMVSARPRNDLLALVAIVVAALGRTQFLLLGLAFPLAVAGHELGFALARRESLAATARGLVRRHAVLAAATAAGLVGYVALKLSGKLGVVLGAYAGTINGDLVPARSGNVSGQLWGVLAVAVGILPVVMAVGWALSAAVRPSDRRGHAFAVLLLVVGALLTWQVSSFLVRFAPTVEDRYFFYIAPLVFTGMAACLRDPRVRWVGMLAAAGAFAWTTTLIDLTPAAPRAFWGSPPVTFNAVLSGRSYQLGNLVGIDNLRPERVVLVLGLVAAAAVALALWRLPRRPVAIAVSALVVVFCVGETAYVNNKISKPMATGTVDGHDWVDQQLPGGAHAATIASATNATADDKPLMRGLWDQYTTWWNAEFWNKSVNRAFQYDGDPAAADAPFSLPALEVDQRTGAVTSHVDTSYFVVSRSDVRQRLAARSLYVDGSSGLELLHAPAPLRLDWLTRGLPYDGFIPTGQPVTLRLFARPGGAQRLRRVSILINPVPGMKHAASYELTAAGGAGSRARGSVPVDGARTAAVTVCPRAPYTDLTLRLTGNVDAQGRPLSLHVARIVAAGPGAPCRPGA